jgi:hypothetical protein
MAGESKVVSASNKNRVLFHTIDEDSAREFVERNYPRHHVDPAAPAMEVPETDVLLVLPNGQEEMFLGPEADGGWVRVPKAGQSAGGKT